MATYHIEQTGTQCVVTWRHFTWAVVFLFVWLTLWTFGCIMLGYLVFVERHFAAFFFALPFWGFWILVAGLIVNMLFGKTTIRLGADGFESDWTCLFVTRSKRIELAELRRFEVHAYPRKGGATYALRVAYGDKHADFSIPTGVGETEPLRDQLNEVLAKLKNEPAIFVAELTSKKPEPIVFELTTPPQGVERPESSSWNYEQDYDGFSFCKRGVFSLKEFLGSLFICCFWNGIVSVFVLALCGVLPSEKPIDPMGWWFMFFFLIPFELIGLVLICGVLTSILAPFRVTKWSFRYGEATFRPAFGRAKSFALDGWKTLAVRLPSDEEDDDDELDAEDVKMLDDAEIWELAFLDRDGKTLVAVDELSKAEALWMADVTLREKRSIS